MLQFAVRSPDKRRFLAALRQQPYPEVPYFDPEFAPEIAGAILEKPAHVRSYQLPPRDYVDLLRCVGVDIAYLHYLYKLARREHVDEKGWAHYVDGTIKTRGDLPRVVPPDFGLLRRYIEQYLEAIEGTGLGWAYAIPGPADITMSIGVQDYFLSMYEDPGFLEEALDRYEAYTLPATELILGYKPDVVFIGLNLCDKNGLMMRREHGERFVLSRLERQLAPVRAAGVPMIVHNDGNNTALMERWIRMGFVGFHPFEPCPGFDIYEAKARWGDRMCLFGNIDLTGVLGQGTPEEVAADVRRHIQELARGGGYVCGSSHDITSDVPLGNLRAMAEEVARTRVG